MADVFISYKSERRAAAEHLAEILSAHGYSVWWDYGLVSGDQFRAEIEREVHAAKAVIVLWCNLSRSSTFVLDEATLAEQSNALVPVKIDGSRPPLGFGSTHTIDLSQWDGAPQSDRLTRLLRDIAEKVGRPARANAARLAEIERAWIRYGSPSLSKFALVDAPSAPRGGDEPPVMKRRAPIALFAAGGLVVVALAAFAVWRLVPVEQEAIPATPVVAPLSVDEVVRDSGVLGQWGVVRPETVACADPKFVVIVSYLEGHLQQRLGEANLPSEAIDADASSARAIVTQCPAGVCNYARTQDDRLLVRYGEDTPQEHTRCTPPAP